VAESGSANQRSGEISLRHDRTRVEVLRPVGCVEKIDGNGTPGPESPLSGRKARKTGKQITSH